MLPVTDIKCYRGKPMQSGGSAPQLYWYLSFQGQAYRGLPVPEHPQSVVLQHFSWGPMWEFIKKAILQE